METGEFKKLLAVVLDDHTVIDEKIKRAIGNERRDARFLLITAVITLVLTVAFVIAIKIYHL